MSTIDIGDMNMKVILCAVLLSLSACSFLGPDDPFAEACVYVQPVNEDINRAFLALRAACKASEE